MTATTTAISPSLGARAWSTTARIAAIVAVLVVLALGSFAFGRSSADDGASSSDAPAAVAPATHSAPAVVSDVCGNAHQPTC